MAYNFYSSSNEQIMPDQILQKDIDDERLKIIYSSSIVSSIAMFSLGVLLVYNLRNDIEHKVLLIWFVLLIIASYLMLHNNYWYIKDQEQGIKNTKKWSNRFIFISCFFGSVWGLASILLFPSESAGYQTLLEMAILGVVAGSIAMVSPSLKATLIFMPLCLVPLVYTVLTNRTENGTTIAVMIVVFFATAIYNGSKYNQRINIQLRLQHEARIREKALKESQKKYQILYDNSHDAMMLFSNNKFLMANQAAVDLFGYKEEEELLLKTSAFDVSPKYQLDGSSSLKSMTAAIGILKQQQLHRLEWLYKRKNGEKRSAEISMSLVLYENKIVIFCIMRDIEENKKLQENLLQAKKESENANKAKSEFLANMSHEIRTPMNGVIGINNLMLQHPLSKKQKSRATVIQQSAESMLTIINDILDFSKIEAGQLNIENLQFNFKNLIQELSSSVINRVEDKKLRYICEISTSLDCWFLGDAIRIRQVLENLINNSLKFTQKGSIKIKVSIVESDEFSSTIKMEIIDTGIGIAKDRQENIFNRFIQADGSTTRKFGGSGLGLSISKQLIDLMGGGIGVISTENKGSNFWVSLKLDKTDKPIKFINSHNINKQYKGPKGRILIVDDNEINQMVVQGILEIFNIESDVAYDGEQALAALDNVQYDLVLMDCHMPIMDGYEATRIIRKKEQELKLSRIPVIAITASAMQGDRERCIDSGMDDYLTKPIELDELQKKLSNWLK